MKAITSRLLLSMLLIGYSITLYSQADGLFADSFESGDLRSTNTDGFNWTTSGTVGVATMNPDPLVVYRAGRHVHEPGPANSDWTARKGEHSLLFKYPAGVNWAEQRFSIGKQYPEIWVSFWLRVPKNYSHPEAAHTNQKLFAIWMDGYEGHGNGPTVVWQFRRQGDGNSISRLYHWGPSWMPNRHSGEATGGRFITVPDDRGKWMHLVFRVVKASSPSVNDGVMQMWQRWENESDYTMLHDDRTGRLHPPQGFQGWSTGYLLGWANAAYPVDTDFLIDDFRISENSLLELSIPRSPRNVQLR